MNRTIDTREEPRPERRGVTLLSVAAGAALAVALVALSTSGPMDAAGERGRIEDTPPTDVPATPQVAALDAGVDWERVERAPDPAPMAVAAYER